MPIAAACGPIGATGSVTPSQALAFFTSGSGVPLAWQYGKPKFAPDAWRCGSARPRGPSSPTQSRPWSVNHSSLGLRDASRSRRELRTPRGDHLHARAVGVVAADLRVLLARRLADVARRAERHVELAVGPKATYFQLWCCSGGRLNACRSCRPAARSGWTRCCRSAAPCRWRTRRASRLCIATPVGCVSLSTTTRTRALAAVVGDLVDAADDARADVDSCRSSPRAIARAAGHAGGPDLGLEARRQLELVDRDLAGRRLGHLAGVRRELGVGLLGALALVPRRRRLGLVLRLARRMRRRRRRPPRRRGFSCWLFSSGGPLLELKLGLHANGHVALRRRLEEALVGVVHDHRAGVVLVGEVVEAHVFGNAPACRPAASSRPPG